MIGAKRAKKAQEPGAGFEPATLRLQGGSSTTELSRRFSESSERGGGARERSGAQGEGSADDGGGLLLDGHWEHWTGVCWSRMAVMTEERLITERITEPIQMGQEARLRNSGVPVWAIIGYLQAVANDVEATARAHEVTVEDVRAAMAYYRQHREALDARLMANTV